MRYSLPSIIIPPQAGPISSTSTHERIPDSNSRAEPQEGRIPRPILKETQTPTKHFRRRLTRKRRESVGPALESQHSQVPDVPTTKHSIFGRSSTIRRRTFVVDRSTPTVKAVSVAHLPQARTRSSECQVRKWNASSVEISNNQAESTISFGNWDTASLRFGTRQMPGSLKSPLSETLVDLPSHCPLCPPSSICRTGKHDQHHHSKAKVTVSMENLRQQWAKVQRHEERLDARLGEQKATNVPSKPMGKGHRRALSEPLRSHPVIHSVDTATLPTIAPTLKRRGTNKSSGKEHSRLRLMISSVLTKSPSHKALKDIPITPGTITRQSSADFTARRPTQSLSTDSAVDTPTSPLASSSIYSNDAYTDPNTPPPIPPTILLCQDKRRLSTPSLRRALTSRLPSRPPLFRNSSTSLTRASSDPLPSVATRPPPPTLITTHKQPSHKHTSSAPAAYILRHASTASSTAASPTTPTTPSTPHKPALATVRRRASVVASSAAVQARGLSTRVYDGVKGLLLLGSGSERDVVRRGVVRRPAERWANIDGGSSAAASRETLGWFSGASSRMASFQGREGRERERDVSVASSGRRAAFLAAREADGTASVAGSEDVYSPCEVQSVARYSGYVHAYTASSSLLVTGARHTWDDGESVQERKFGFNNKSAIGLAY